MITPQLRAAAKAAMKRRKERMDYESDNIYAAAHRKQEDLERVKRIIVATMGSRAVCLVRSEESDHV